MSESQGHRLHHGGTGAELLQEGRLLLVRLRRDGTAICRSSRDPLATVSNYLHLSPNISKHCQRDSHLAIPDTTRCNSTTSINLHTYVFHSNSASSDSFHSAMSNPSEMDIESNLDRFNQQQPFPPSPTPAQTGEQDPTRPIVITLAMYNDFMNRLTYVESYNDSLRDRCATLAERNASLSTQCITLSTQYVNLSNQLQNNLSNQLQNNLSNHLQSHPSTLEPKIADAPPFSGNRKDLLPFLTKCRLKFGGQPLRFGSEKSKVLYAGARLEGPAFGWFQPLVAKWDTTGADPPPLELSSFETFATELTSLYGDPNLAASAEREICRLRQTSAVANYVAKFEEHRQYLEWNDAALRDQFYRGLKDEIKDGLAPLGRPATLAKLKELATRFDSRLQERVLERRQAYPTPGIP